MPDRDLTPRSDIDQIRSSMAPAGFSFLTNHPVRPLDGETPLGRYLRDLRKAYGDENVFVTRAVDGAGGPMPDDRAIFVRDGIVSKRTWLDRWLERRLKQRGNATD